jgi:hypothetical protein
MWLTKLCDLQLVGSQSIKILRDAGSVQDAGKVDHPIRILN